MGEQERSGVALSVQASTMGPSVGLHVEVSETVRIRARGAFLPYSFSRDLDGDDMDEIGRASCRERVCLYV